MSRKAKEAVLRGVLGENVRVLRARRRLTQEQLAERAGSSQTYISDVELASIATSVDMIERIAVALEVPAWRLLKPDEET